MIHDYIETLHLLLQKNKVLLDVYKAQKNSREPKTSQKEKRERSGTSSRKRLCLKHWPLLHRIPAQHVVWAPTIDPRVFNTLFSQIISFPHPFVFMPVIRSGKEKKEKNRLLWYTWQKNKSKQAVLFILNADCNHLLYWSTCSHNLNKSQFLSSLY